VLFRSVFVMPFALRELGFGPAQSSVILVSSVVGSIVGAPIVARISDIAGMRLTLTWVFGLSAIAILGLIAIQELALIVAGLLVLGACLGGVTALTQGRIAEEARVAGVPTASALSGMRLAQSIGPGLGPSVAGIGYVHGGLPWAEALALCSLLGGLVLTRTGAITAYAPAATPIAVTVE